MPVTAVDKALRLLGVRGHSEAELRAKLFRAGYPEEECDNAVSVCKKHGFLNDALLASDSAELQLQRGSGVRKIRQKLRQKGLPAEVVDEALLGREEEELQSALAAMETKLRLLRTEKDPRKKREKLLRFLIGRGFSMDTVRKAMIQAAHLPQEEQDFF